MSEYTNAIWRVWDQFELDGVAIPAYQPGTVPTNQAFPYITFEVVAGDAFSTAPASATVWCKYTGDNSSPAIAQRMAILEAMGEAIPPDGLRVNLTDGFVMLHRGSGDYMSHLVDDNDPTVIGGRLGYEITFYVI